MRRSPEEQVAAEAELGRRLRDAPEGERRTLYGAVYDEIYGMSLASRGETAEAQTFGANPRLLGLLERLAGPGEAVLELGCGTGYLCIELARLGRDVCGVDVSSVALERARLHGEGTTARFELASALELPFGPASFDLVFSVEVLEHLHPADARSHFDEAWRVLRPGGRYWVLTPSRIVAHSVEERFGVEDARADGVHLKEWTYGELVPALRGAGFKRIRSPWRNGLLHALPLLPVGVKLASERAVAAVPALRARRAFAAALGTAACSVVAVRP